MERLRGFERHTNFYNLTLGAAMFLGRFGWPSRCWQSLAASLQRKRFGFTGHPADQWTDVRLRAVGIIMIVAALTSSRTVPGPIVEHGLMQAGAFLGRNL